MKFALGQTVYDVSDVHDLSLKMILQLEQETREFGRPITLGDLERMAAEVEALKTDKERALHPDGPWVLGITIWASRKLAGEAVSFEQAIDFPMSELRFIKEPQDRKAPATPRKARPRTGSGRAAASRQPAAAKKTSGSRSTAG